MRYKEMVLLEDLLESFSPEQGYRMFFMMDEQFLCTGEFRKRFIENGMSYVDYSLIDSEKLLKDYKEFINDNEDNRQYIIELIAHTQGDTEYKEEKMENYLLGSMCKFLTNEDINLNDYLIGYDGPEVIYDFTPQGGDTGDFILDGEKIEPISLYVLDTRENQWLNIHREPEFIYIIYNKKPDWIFQSGFLELVQWKINNIAIKSIS